MNIEDEFFYLHIGVSKHPLLHFHWQAPDQPFCIYSAAICGITIITRVMVQISSFPSSQGWNQWFYLPVIYLVLFASYLFSLISVYLYLQSINRCIMVLYFQHKIVIFHNCLYSMLKIVIFHNYLYSVHSCDSTFWKVTIFQNSVHNWCIMVLHFQHKIVIFHHCLTVVS